MDWTLEEVKLIIPYYFEMLNEELSHKQYSKTYYRNNLLINLKNRNKGSVEFKHQNISAILMEMGLPFIKGYKPRYNYQQLLSEELAKYISLNKFELEKKFEKFSTVNELNQKNYSKIEFDSILIDEPINSSIPEKEVQFKPIKTNYLKKEQNNRTLGEFGESLVIEYEKWRLIKENKESLVDKIEWISKDLGDGTGFDILSKNTNGTDRFIEVKTTKLSKETPIYVTKNEVQFAKKYSSQFYLYRIFNFDTKPGLFIKTGIYSNFCTLKAETFKGYFG